MKNISLAISIFAASVLAGCGLPRTDPTPVDHLSTFTHTFELPEDITWQSDFKPYDPISSLNDSSFSRDIAGATPLRIHGLSSSTAPSFDRYLSVASGTLIYDENLTLKSEAFKQKILSILDDLKFYNKEMAISDLSTLPVSGGTCYVASGEFKKNYSYARKDVRPAADYYLWKHAYMFCLPESSKHTAAWIFFKEHRAPEQSPLLESVVEEVTGTMKLH